MSSLIKINNLSKSFFTEDIETRALSSINMEINQGDYVSFTGRSGCGKSTLLTILGLLDLPTQGEYFLDGQNVAHLSRNARADIRNSKIGFVFQSFNLISDLNVTENVMLPLTYSPGFNRKKAEEKALEVLEQVEMSHRKHHHPSQLSGGQQQRVAVARALINDPEFILADEPTGNLDSQNATSVMKLFDQLHLNGSTLCIVTHDPRSAERAERQIHLFDGQIVSDHLSQQSINPTSKEAVFTV